MTDNQKRVQEVLDGFPSLDGIKTGTFEDITEALAALLDEAETRGYARAAQASRAVCSRAGGCLP